MLLEDNIQKSASVILKYKQVELSKSAARLEALSPLSVLSRGFAAVYSNDEKVITTVKDIKEDDILNLKMKDGTVTAAVKSVHMT